MKIETHPKKLRRTEIRTILKRHPGSMGDIARQLGITTQAVSLWLAGKSTSQRVAKAAQEKACEFLKQEQQHAA